MGIAPIGAVASPQIYNVNSVSSKSLNKIKGISDDLTRSRTDFTGLVEDYQENVNSLAKGETKDFDGLAQMAMAMGQNRAAMLFE